MLFPLVPNLQQYTGDDPDQRIQAEAFNRIARLAAASVDRRAAAGEAGWRQFDFMDIAEELSLPVELVRKALHRGNANGLTLFVGEEELRALKRLLSNRGVH
jgi:DNA-directed RNA polymerase specialized sigma24 family protein